MKDDWHRWSGLGKPWAGLHHIAVASNLDGRQEVFAVAADGSLWHIWQTALNNGWSHWETRDRPTAEGIELVSPTVGRSLVVQPNHDGRLEAVVIASRQLWRIAQTTPNNGWGPWDRLGEPSGSGGIVSLDLVRDRKGLLRLFAIGYSNHMFGRRQTVPGGDWADWETDFPRDDRLPFISFATGENTDGRLEIVTNLSGVLALVTESEPGAPFRGGFGNVGVTAGADSIGSLGIARNQDGTLEAATTIGGDLVHLRQREPNQPPSPGGGGWARLDLHRPEANISVRGPVLIADRDQRLNVFVLDSDGTLWHRRQASPGGPWDPWRNLGSPSPSGSQVTSHAVGRNADGRLEVFAVDRGELRHTWQTGS